MWSYMNYYNDNKKKRINIENTQWGMTKMFFYKEASLYLLLFCKILLTKIITSN